MNRKKFAAGLLGGITLALLTSGPASAYVVTFFTVQDRTASSPSVPIPFTLLNLGTSSGDTFVSALPGSTGGVSYSFTPGSADPSGIYSGGVSSVSASPYGDPDHTTNYFTATGGGGSVLLDYGANIQNSLSMVWGTVDPGAVRNLLVTLGTGGDSIDGDQINTACGGCITNLQNQELWLTISDLSPFTMARFSDNDTPAFEFNVAAPSNVAPVPEFSTWGMMILGFMGLGFLGYRRSARSSGAAFRMA